MLLTEKNHNKLPNINKKYKFIFCIFQIKKK